MACILRKCLIPVGNGTEYSYSCSHSQYTVYGAYHSSMSCLKVSSNFPHMPMQIDVWTVSNLTFVLLSFKLLHSTTEVPFIVLAIYSLRSGTLKRVNGDATRAVCRLRKDVSEALYAIPCDKSVTHCRMTVSRRQSSHHRAWSVSNAARSRRPRVAVSSPGADT